MFRGCKNLREVHINEGVTMISEAMFSYCYVLEQVVIPKSVVKMERRAFDSSPRLQKIYFLGDAPQINFETFDGAGPLAKIFHFEGKTGYTSPSWEKLPIIILKEFGDDQMWLINYGFSHDADWESELTLTGLPILAYYALNMGRFDTSPIIPEITENKL